jgi:hypothetical protein
MVFLRHTVVGLLALALAIGSGWQPCATLQQQVATAPIDHMASHQSHEHYRHAMAHDHDHDALGNNYLVTDKAQPKSADDACQKCCGACMVTSIMPLGPEWTVIPVVSRVSFASLSEQLRGHIVLVDPDIPKHIV